MRMKRSDLLISNALDNLACTKEERDDLIEHLRDADCDSIVCETQAEDYITSMLEMLRECE